MANRPPVARTVTALRRALPACRKAANASRWCRPWARCTAAIWRLCAQAHRRARPGGGVDLRQSHAIRAATRISPAIRAIFAADIKALAAAKVDLVWAPTAAAMYPAGLCHPHRAAGRGQSRSGRQVPPAFLRRRRHRRGQAVHAMRARFRFVRREGLPATARRSPRWPRISTCPSR